LTDPSNPFRLDTSNNPIIILATDLLTSDNYSTWLHDLLFNLWESCNDMVVSWLQNSISPSIKSNVAFVDDARELWLDLEDRFSHQKSNTISVYYGKLKTLWNELLIYDSILVCNCGSMKILSDCYQRDQIMLLDPLPPFTKVFSLIQQQERHYQMVSDSPSPDSMAFAIRQPYPNSNKFPPQSKPKKAPVCSHCNMTRHTMEKCYKLHGYPPSHKLFTKS
ncbi:hypothetical protein I3843_05G095300, partial [Carya illinoinensis]